MSNDCDHTVYEMNCSVCKTETLAVIASLMASCDRRGEPYYHLFGLLSQAGCVRPVLEMAIEHFLEPGAQLTSCHCQSEGDEPTCGQCYRKLEHDHVVLWDPESRLGTSYCVSCMMEFPEVSRV